MRSAITERQAGISSELRVLCFGSSTECYLVCESVRTLGYVPRIVSTAQWRLNERLTIDEPTILFLGGPEFPKELLFSALSEARAPVLAIFGSGGCDWDGSLAGACSDFLNWPCHEREFRLRLVNVFALPQAGPKQPVAESVANQFLALKILGESPLLQTALHKIRAFAACDAPVLVEGETGTGKELASRAIHYFSARRDRAFVPITCGAMPDNLLENELFGHARGAYTDAKAPQVGLVAQAEGGTVFLDEVDTLSPRSQAAILRFLETREYRPLGSGVSRHADVRIIAATNVDLEKLVDIGQFRRDLFFRLNVLAVQLPSLAARGSDVRFLAEHFAREYSQLYGKPFKALHPETLNWMERYAWPGNIRELQNVVHRGRILSSDPTLRISAGSATAVRQDAEEGSAGEPGTFRSAKANAIRAFEKQYLQQVLAESGGNVSQAARRAGKERRSLGKLLKKHGLASGTQVDMKR